MTVSRFRPARILLVEDDAGDQELTKRALARGRVTNDLRIVEDGEEALDYLFQRGRYAGAGLAPRPDLVLLDLNLPRVDGREVLAEMRASKALHRMVVVILTTSEQEGDVLRSYDLGANSYIVKPVDMKQFLRVVQSLEEYWLQVVVLPPSAETNH